ncbi:MAG: aspartyl/asparaginyl beta-hydroxylase domain-containing protein, partial [Dokdonella sp.]
MSQTSTSAIALADLLAKARAAFEQGRMADADRGYAEILEKDPAAFDALKHLGMRALAQGHGAQAVLLLDRARSVQPFDADMSRHLGNALRASGRLEEALVALREAVRLDPDFFAAQLQLGAVCEELGRTRESIAIYFGAVSTAHSMGRWINDATTAPSLRPLVRHAIKVIDEGRERLFGELLAPHRDRHGASALARVDKCLAIYLGGVPASWADPRQKPSFLYFPDLPTVTYFDRALFPWYEALESRTEAIRAELESVLEDASAFESFFKPKPGMSTEEHLGGTRADPRWDAFFFYRHGTRYEENCRRCPQTAAALDAVPIVRLPGHAPECLYSKLTPGSHIRAHRGVTNTRVVTHLPLIVPGNGALSVGGESHEWQQGRCVTFDDTFLHEAWNHSERTRVVVLLDTWNPYMTEIEIAACSDLVMAISGF